MIYEADFVDTSYGYRPNRSAKETIEENRYLKGAEFIKALNRKLQGHYNFYNVYLPNN